MKREDVFERISGEREYQDRIHGHLQNTTYADDHRSIEYWLICIEQQLNKAKEEVYNSYNGQEVRNRIRKMAALCVACMENNETSARER